MLIVLIRMKFERIEGLIRSIGVENTKLFGEIEALQWKIEELETNFIEISNIVTPYYGIKTRKVKKLTKEQAEDFLSVGKKREQINWLNEILIASDKMTKEYPSWLLEVKNYLDCEDEETVKKVHDELISSMNKFAEWSSRKLGNGPRSTFPEGAIQEALEENQRLALEEEKKLYQIGTNSKGVEYPHGE
jgi:hypothetical protein